MIILTAAGLATYAGMAGLHWRYGSLRDSYTPFTLGWYGLAFAVYLAALFWAERQKRVAPAILWGGAVAFRVALLFTLPTLSDDVYRYLWDGHVALHGVSPYAYPIDSPALDGLDIPLRSLANNRWMASPYLPAAQVVFAGLARIFPLHPLVMQIFMVLFDLLSGLLLVKLLKLAQLPGYRVLVYLWNPLVVVEVAHAAHIDAWMIFLTLLAFWLTFSPNRAGLSTWLAPPVLALATLTKVLPVLLVPVLFWRWPRRLVLVYAGTAAALLAPFGIRAGWGLTGPLDGTGLFGAIRIYADQWNFNSGLFHWLEVDLLPALGVATAAEDVARRIVLAALAAVLAVIWLKARGQTGVRFLLRLAAAAAAAYLLLATTVHPWYALLLLAFVPFLSPGPDESPWQWMALAPWLYLSAALPLSYLTYLDPLDFRELEWVRNIEWRPTLGLLAVWAGVWPFVFRRRAERYNPENRALKIERGEGGD